MKYKYHSGEQVMQGDEVLVWSNGQNHSGKVVRVLVPGSSEAVEWGAPDGGVFIEGGGLGLFVMTSLAEDPDIVLVRRRP